MPSDLIDLVLAYAEAVNRHDQEAALAMFAENAEYELVEQTVVSGKEQIRAVHAYDAGINAHVELSDLIAEGEAVACRMTEHNDWMRAAGLGAIEYPSSVFTFHEGLIVKVVLAMAEETLDAIGEVLHAFTPWLFANHPAEAGRLFTVEGDFVYSRENGELVVKLLKEWRSGGNSHHSH